MTEIEIDRLVELYEKLRGHLMTAWNPRDGSEPPGDRDVDRSEHGWVGYQCRPGPERHLYARWRPKRGPCCDFREMTFAEFVRFARSFEQ